MSPNNSLTIVYDVVATTCSRKNRIIAIMFQRENCLDSKNQNCFFNVPWYAIFYLLLLNLGSTIPPAIIK